MNLFMIQILLFVFVNAQEERSSLCHRPCNCQNEPTGCSAGTSLVLDGCNCCKVCAKLLGEQCDGVTDVCDPHRNLFCDFTQSRNGDWGICVVQSGRPCLYEGGWLTNGAMYQPSCKQQCWCMNSDVGCMSLCPHETQLPRSDLCPNARLRSVPGQCCDEWVCDREEEPEIIPGDQFWSDYVSNVEESTTEVSNPLARDARVSSTTLDNLISDIIYESDGGADGDELIDYQQIHVGTPSTSGYAEEIGAPGNYLPGEEASSNSQSGGSCISRASAWSSCSKTCGLGISSRVSNNNRQCTLMRETRLCMLRPCAGRALKLRRGRRCTRQTRAPKRRHITYAGCTSVRSLKPRFCGVCTDSDRCCRPSITRTTKLRFRCTDGRFFYKNFMIVKNCRCHKNCSG